MLTNTFILLSNWIEMSKIILPVSSGMGGRCVCPSWRLQLPWSAQSSRPSESMYHKNGLSDGTSINSFTSEVRTCQCTVSKYLSCVESVCVCVCVCLRSAAAAILWMSLVPSTPRAMTRLSLTCWRWRLKSLLWVRGFYRWTGGFQVHIWTNNGCWLTELLKLGMNNWE